MNNKHERMHLRDAFALDVGALKFGVELASLNMLVYFGTLIVFDKLGTIRIYS